MAGRAGRRGKDRLGNVWNIVTRKHPPPLVRKYTISQKIVAWQQSNGTCTKSSTDWGGGIFFVSRMQVLSMFCQESCPTFGFSVFYT